MDFVEALSRVKASLAGSPLRDLDATSALHTPAGIGAGGILGSILKSVMSHSNNTGLSTANRQHTSIFVGLDHS